eukprot:PITA_01749
MSNSNQVLVPEFDGNDYDYWSIKMLTFLIGKYVYEIVESGYEEPSDWNTLTTNERITRKQARKKNAQALFHIQIALDKSLFLRISGAKNTKAAWETLQEAYQGSDQVKVVKLQILKREFENLKMQEVESVSDYCVRVKDVVNKMATLGEAISNEVLIKKELRYLTHRWNHVAIIMEESKDLTKLQFDELVGSLMSHEGRLKETFEAVGKDFPSKLQITNNEDTSSSSTKSHQGQGNEKLFSAKDGSFKSMIELGDDKPLEVAAKRAMEVKTKEGIKSIHNIYYNPQLNHNLLSVGQLCEENYKVVFQNKTCTIYDKNKGNRVIIVVPMPRNRMFPLRFDEYNNNHANMAYEDSLWHLRYGHLNFQSLMFLTSHALVSGFPKVEEHKEVCEGCDKGNHARERFPNSRAWRAHHPL